MDSLSSYIDTVGHPYRWAQWLAGLDFLTQDGVDSVQASTSVSSSHMEATVKALKARVKSRLTLNQQLLCLGMLRNYFFH